MPFVAEWISDDGRVLWVSDLKRRTPDRAIAKAIEYLDGTTHDLPDLRRPDGTIYGVINAREV